ncbi:hypothetical protein [Chryseosolibacter indicus]|uniref:Uncharacterized protein n=1 Tax=Chryseosolibacter indicus TaxID=2782351 RepID=A0ABS5VNE3_9BACT|nr:hypothetical protein [Chryseosolibacter indicus]MBT1702292.1 hypothetical protein [Chryseosolibacter indicus]
MKSTISLLLVICLSSRCSTTNQSEPEKVKGIPDHAFWVGGADGGQWYLIRDIEKVSSTAAIAIYNDNTGDLEADKRFTLICNSASLLDLDNLKNEIEAFDGETIFLKRVDSDGRNCILK